MNDNEYLNLIYNYYIGIVGPSGGSWDIHHPPTKHTPPQSAYTHPHIIHIFSPHIGLKGRSFFYMFTETAIMILILYKVIANFCTYQKYNLILLSLNQSHKSKVNAVIL